MKACAIAASCMSFLVGLWIYTEGYGLSWLQDVGAVILD